MRNDLGHIRKKQTYLRRILFVGSAFVVGLLFMVMLHREQFGLLLAHFGELWRIEQNRSIIFVLLFHTLLVAVAFAAIALSVYLLSSARQRFRLSESSEEQVDVPARQTAEHPLSVPTPSRRAQMGSSAFAFPPSFAQESTSRSPDAPMAGQTSSLTPHDDTCGSQPEMTAYIPEVSPSHEASPQNPEPGRSQQEHAKSGPIVTAPTTGQIYIEINLLKTVTMSLLVPGSNTRYQIPVDDLYSRAKHLIAYIASKKGQSVRLDDMRTHVFGSDEADIDQIQSAFSTAKRDIRRRIDQAVRAAYEDAGEAVVPEDLDIFALAKNRRYSLPPYCRVVDLCTIEELQQVIERAENNNLLVNTVPHHVKEACDALIKAYTGDFLEDVLAEDPEAIDSWVQSWAREPFTLYRDAYLQALLYAGEYERKAGDNSNDPARSREHYATAARLFVKGAMAACNKRIYDGRFDTKVVFAKNGRRAGQHVILSEQLIRRGIACYGKIGSTTLANRAYGAYEQQMLLISGRSWSPDQETLNILEDALKNTGAYRFPDAIATPYGQESRLTKIESA